MKTWFQVWCQNGLEDIECAMIDLNDLPEHMQPINSVPVTIFYENGQEIDRRKGFLTESQMLDIAMDHWPGA
jgi:hypothetical protein